MRTWKKLDGMLVGSSILALASCVVVADAVWWSAAKEKLYTRNGGG